LSEIRELANNVLEAYNQLAKSQVQHSWTDKIWDVIYRYVRNTIIPKKSEEELQREMYLIFKTMQPYFQRLATNEQANEGKQLGSIPIPPVGQLDKDVKLVQISIEDKQKVLEYVKQHYG